MSKGDLTHGRPQPPNSSNDISNEALLWIVRLHSGSMTESDREAYAGWIAASPLNKQADEEAQALWKVMSRLQVDPSSGLITTGGRPKGVSRRQAMLGLAGLAATASVTGAVWSSGSLASWLSDYSTSTASMRSVDLEDGTRITLNACSAINVNLTAARRSVHLLKGQAYFEVAPDAARPFDVFIDDVSITALGTAFDISRNVPGIRAELEVAKHSIRVNSRGSMTDVREGQSVSITDDGTVDLVKARSTSVAGTWRDGTYVAEDRALAEVIAALSSWYWGKVFITSSSLAALKVNAVLDLRDPIGSLNTLQAGLPLRVRHVSKYFSIISVA